jgi:hypothetical protein
MDRCIPGHRPMNTSGFAGAFAAIFNDIFKLDKTMDKKSDSRPFDRAQWEAGAPIGCRGGAEACILHSEKALIGMVTIEGKVSASQWKLSGEWTSYFVGDTSHLDLVMLPLGYVEGKPVFVGDKLESSSGAYSVTVSPTTSLDGPWHWPVALNFGPECGRAFGQALCHHFGLDTAKVEAEVEMVTNPDKPFGVKLQIWLSGGDLEAIGAIMAAQSADKANHA